MKKETIICLTLLLLPVSFIAAQAVPAGRTDTAGPMIRVDKIALDQNALAIEGSVVDSYSPIKQISYSTDYSGPGPDSPVKAGDGAYDAPREQFSVFLSSPQSGIFYLKTLDEAGNKSLLTLDLTVRPDYQGYVLYLSSDALNAEEIKVDNFTVAYTASVGEDVLRKVSDKLSNLNRIAGESFGFKNYASFCVMLCPKQEAATFRWYRGQEMNGVFTFPVPADILKVSAYNYTLDDWIPHEMGDHTVRAYALHADPGQLPGGKVRWLSEGIGDYLAYLYLKEYYPAKRDVYSGRVKAYSGKDETVDLLDGRWSPKHYLCSAALIFGIAKERGSGVFKQLFARLNSLPPGGSSERAARDILSELTGEDITAKASSCSTEQAAKILKSGLD